MCAANARFFSFLLFLFFSFFRLFFFLRALVFADEEVEAHVEVELGQVRLRSRGVTLGHVLISVQSIPRYRATCVSQYSTYYQNSVARGYLVPHCAYSPLMPPSVQTPLEEDAGAERKRRKKGRGGERRRGEERRTKGERGEVRKRKRGRRG
eukprot:3095446-Rhodomonas_salina.1